MPDAPEASKIIPLSSQRGGGVRLFWMAIVAEHSIERVGKKKEKEMETPPGHGEELILRCFPDFV
uniref:Uncharacterized protein n=1 Tax=Heterorhabditis bacteriophora TaxID=37862 RepID=A0A1I7W7Q5_HETBA